MCHALRSNSQQTGIIQFFSNHLAPFFKKCSGLSVSTIKSAKPSPDSLLERIELFFFFLWSLGIQNADCFA